MSSEDRTEDRTKDQILAKIDAAFEVSYIDIINESRMHGGPATCSHYKLVMVSDDFTNLSPVKRHQAIYALLSAEMEGSVHALALHTYTQEEWAENAHKFPASPDCRGGSKA